MKKIQTNGKNATQKTKGYDKPIKKNQIINKDELVLETSSKIIQEIEDLKRKLWSKVDELWANANLTKKDFKTDVPILIEIQKMEKYTNKKMEQIMKKNKGKLTFASYPFKSSPIFTHDFFNQYKKIK